MRFHFLTSNPAFNIAVPGNKAGTGGNTTLYQTATRRSMELCLPNGYVLNLTLKGIIKDLINGRFKDKQTHWINLMDDLDIWDYNTCYFALQNTERYSSAIITGGASSTIYTPYHDEQFPMVYYSGSNKSMDKKFGQGNNKVIRRLPGRNNNGVIYDYTSESVSAGPKFAFNVMESRKSYYVTDEPIYGGTICYINTNTIEEAEKLKLFVEVNDYYKQYIKHMKIKYHAFGLRNIRRFNLSQIKTGYEKPEEWKLSEQSFTARSLINENILNVNKVKELGQVFTPAAVVNKMYEDLIMLEPASFIDPSYTFCDTMCGNGRFVINAIQRKIKNGIPPDVAISTVYGSDIDTKSILELRETLSNQYPLLENLITEQFVIENGLTYNFKQAHFNTLFK